MSPRHTRRRGARLRIGWKLGRFIGLVLVMVGVAAAGIYQVHARYELVRLGYALDNERFEHRRLLETHKRLRLSLASYQDPEAVRVMAEERLGMRVAGQEDELVVPDDRPGGER
jgi:cell division protein FtsL